MTRCVCTHPASDHRLRHGCLNNAACGCEVFLEDTGDPEGYWGQPDHVDSSGVTPRAGSDPYMGQYGRRFAL